MEKFADLFLNTSLYKQLASQIQNDTFSQTHIISSIDEFSNQILSRLISFALICKNKSFCGQCEECIKLKSQSHPDLKQFATDKSFVVADAASILDDVYKSSYSGNKVYIINNIDLATVPAQNKLLKILEEPPKNVYFILNTTNPSSVLQTILSRAIKISLKPFDYQDLKQYFSLNNLEFNDNAYSYGQGYIGKILQFENDAKFQSVFSQTLEILQKVQKSSDIILYSENIKKDDMNIFLNALQIFISDLMYIKTNNHDLIKSSYKQSLIQLSSQFSLGAISHINKNIVIASQHLGANVNYALVKDKLLLSILEAKYIYKD